MNRYPATDEQLAVIEAGLRSQYGNLTPEQIEGLRTLEEIRSGQKPAEVSTETRPSAGT